LLTCIERYPEAFLRLVVVLWVLFARVELFLVAWDGSILNQSLMLREASNAARGLDTTRNGVICFTGEEKPIAVGGQSYQRFGPWDATTLAVGPNY
jgi:hypothetical protein